MAVTLDLYVERPESRELGELVRGYYTMMRMLGFDLGLTAQRKLSPSRGAYWFVNFIADRKQSNPKRFPANQQYDYRDPTLVLKDYAHEFDSPYREAFGYNEAMGLAAKKIIWTRNSWFHFGVDPTLEDLMEVTQYVRTFADAAGLACLGQVVALLTRLQRIKTGQYQPTSVRQQAASLVEIDNQGEISERAEEAPAEVAIPDDAPRSRIGGIWTGAIPDTRYKVTRTGDIVDADTFESLRTRVGENFARKSRQWLAVQPRGGEVWVASDGAVGGWINEYPRLLGYLGEDPAGEKARGFFIPHYYEVQGVSIRDLDSGEILTSEVAASVDDGTLLRVTTYGDVLIIDDANDIERLTTVTPADWFPGHLG